LSVKIENLTDSLIPAVDFDGIKNACLGPSYKLSLVITDAHSIKKLNLIYRGKREPTDILSFPLTEDEGEIHLCPEIAAKESKKWKRNYENFFAFLFIHGCAHLKGYDHRRKMETYEAKLRKQLGV